MGHETVVSEYHNSSMIIRTAERVIRQSKNLTVENLEREFNKNERLNSIHEKEDPDEIAEIIQEELTKIIDGLTHPRIIQVKKKDNPTLSKETRKMMEMNKKNLTKAKKSQSKKDWIEYRRNRNIIADMVNKDKDKKIEKLLENDKERWNILKNICNKEEFEIPKEIKTKKGVERKPRHLANLANNHYIEKIQKIMMEMPKTTTTPMKILKKLIPRQEKTMKFNLISLEKMKMIIQKLPNTASHGYDPITNRTIKKIESRITPVMTHLINSIIKTEKFPKILKKTRIIPILKKGKPVDEIDSYRPINNLPCIEKIVEEHMKREMETFIKENKIMNKSHHGGRKNHSTVTAKVTIEHEALKENEEGRTVAIYSIDLSAAFDTISHSIIRSKLEHYGFRGQSGNLLKSYLHGREQYVEI